MDLPGPLIGIVLSYNIEDIDIVEYDTAGKYLPIALRDVFGAHNLTDAVNYFKILWGDRLVVDASSLDGETPMRTTWTKIGCWCTL